MGAGGSAAGALRSVTVRPSPADSGLHVGARLAAKLGGVHAAQSPGIAVDLHAGGVGPIRRLPFPRLWTGTGLAFAQHPGFQASTQRRLLGTDGSGPVPAATQFQDRGTLPA